MVFSDCRTSILALGFPVPYIEFYLVIISIIDQQDLYLILENLALRAKSDRIGHNARRIAEKQSKREMVNR
jgi:hypothetical protein